jgi:hypothetical protein
VRRAVATGAGIWILAAIAAGALAWLAYTAGRAPQASVRGYAQVAVDRDTCYIDPKTGLNVLDCEQVRPNAYAIDFSESVQGSVAVATPAPCCPNSVGVGVSGIREVTVRLFGHPRYPGLISVVVP